MQTLGGLSDFVLLVMTKVGALPSIENLVVFGF